eukprot:129847-Prorocentrum_minimum.AAC.4
MTHIRGATGAGGAGVCDSSAEGRDSGDLPAGLPLRVQPWELRHRGRQPGGAGLAALRPRLAGALPPGWGDIEGVSSARVQCKGTPEGFTGDPQGGLVSTLVVP